MPSYRSALFLAYLLLLDFPAHRAVNLPIRDARYRAASYCPGMVLAQSFRYRVLVAWRLLNCVASCLADAGCLSVVHEAPAGLCHLGSDVADPDCTNMEPAGVGARHYQRRDQGIQCQNGGSVLGGNTCDCTEPYYGPRCEKIMRDCSDVPDPETSMETHIIWPTSAPAPFSVRCNNNYEQTFIFRRSLGQEDFNRTWQEYVDGFGQISKEFWIGLDRLHQITINTNRTYLLRMFVILTNGTKYNVGYTDFQLGGADSGYAFTASPKGISELEDCMTPLVGAPFSTRDNDSSANCALLHGGVGWWYSGEACSRFCSPLGRPVSEGTSVWSGDPLDAFWAVPLLGNVSLSRASAALSPV